MSDYLRETAIHNDLRCGVMGGEVRFFQEIDSTNLEAIRLARKGAAEGLVILAEAQLMGRGRSGREWFSPSGLNIYMSVILRPRIRPREAPRISFMAAVAAARCCMKNFQFLPQIKWPNDLLYQGKKFAGILSEMSANMDSINYVVLGMGINVNIPHALFPPGLAPFSTSIREVVGRSVSREPFIISLLEGLDYWYGVLLREGFGPIREEWSRMSAFSDRPIQVRDGDRSLSGRALRLEEDGSLMLETPDGTIHRIISGDLVLEARI